MFKCLLTKYFHGLTFIATACCSRTTVDVAVSPLLSSVDKKTGITKFFALHFLSPVKVVGLTRKTD